MLRIPRQALDAAVEAFMCAAIKATNTAGLRVYFALDQKKAEAAVLGALSILAPNGGPCTAADVFFVHDGNIANQYPPPPKKTGTIAVEEGP